MLPFKATTNAIPNTANNTVSITSKMISFFSVDVSAFQECNLKTLEVSQLLKLIHANEYIIDKLDKI